MDIILKRILDAPAELVWKAWTGGQMYVYSTAGLHQTIDKLVENLA